MAITLFDSKGLAHATLSFASFVEYSDCRDLAVLAHLHPSRNNWSVSSRCATHFKSAVSRAACAEGTQRKRARVRRPRPASLEPNELPARETLNKPVSSR